MFDKYQNKRIIICTDSNCRNTLWGDKITNQRGEKLEYFINFYNLNILNNADDGPTFIKRVQSKKTNQNTIRTSNIDLTLSNFVENRSKLIWKFSNHLSNSEHRPIQIEIQIKSRLKYNYEEIKKINYNKSNWNLFLKIYNESKPNLKSVKDSKIAKNLTSAIKIASDKALVYSKIKICREEPWQTPELKSEYDKLMNLRRKICKLKKKKIDSQLIDELSRANYKYKKNKIKAIYKHIHEQSKIDSEEKLWKVWNRSKERKEKLKKINLINNSSNSEQGNNQLFRNQFIKTTNKKFDKLNIKCNRSLPPTNEEELNEIILKLNNSKAPGPDRITNRLIKIIYQNDKPYIIEIFNRILKSGSLPNAWKNSKMIYFMKPGKTGSNETDYRPITLINGFCKICERLIITRIEEELNNKKYLSNSQYGFKRGVSTVNAIHDLIKHIKKNKVKYKFNVLISVDISGAFDGVNWNKVIDNVINCDLSPNLVMSLQSLLTERIINLNNQNYKSERGLPQGGKASPTLWNIALNDLLNSIDKMLNVKAFAYADDIALVINADNQNELNQILKNVFSQIENWCEDAELKVNPDKTSFMNISKSKKKLKIRLNNKRIKLCEEIKYLGVIIDRKLLWNRHLRHLESKTSKLIPIIRKFIWLDEEIELNRRIRIYKSVFLPTITYASSIWFPDIKNKISYINRLKVMQRKILNSLLGIYKSTNSEKLLRLLNIVSIEEEMIILEQLKSTLKVTPKPNRRLLIREQQQKIIDKKQSFYFEINAHKTYHKYVLWVVTGKGPFRDYLNLVKIANDKWCRYCWLYPETAIHLVEECEQIDRNLYNPHREEEFQLFCINLIRKLIRDRFK